MHHPSQSASQQAVKPVKMKKVSLGVAILSFFPTLFRITAEVNFLLIFSLIGIFILSTIFFVGLTLYYIFKFKFKQTLFSLVGLAIAILPVTPIGHTLAAQCGLAFNHGHFNAQVENVRRGLPTIHSVRGYKVINEKNPNRVLFESSNVFHVTAFVYSTSGFIDSDRYSCSLKVKISLLGDWYYCVWD